MKLQLQAPNGKVVDLVVFLNGVTIANGCQATPGDITNAIDGFVADLARLFNTYEQTTGRKMSVTKTIDPERSYRQGK